MNYILKQLDGLYQGQYDAALKYGKIPLSKEQLYQIAMQADLNDLLKAFNPNSLSLIDKPRKFNNETKNELKFLQERECSGFVKFNNKTNSLISSHNTHNLYSLMNRIFKYYDFEIKIDNKKINSYKYSSRPADLNSKDDYYTLSNDMVVIETSLNIWDLEIYKNLRYETVPKWIRVNIANKLADNNLEWINLFFKYNSGTHCNQWLIVDYKKFDEYVYSLNNNNNNNKDTQKESIYNKLFVKEEISKLEYERSFNGLKDIDYPYYPSENSLNLKNLSINSTISKKDLGIIHLVEQIPLLDKAYFKDFSEELINEGYVASYNAPYFPEVIELAGYEKYNQKNYFTANRHFLFKNFSEKIESIDDVKVLMRYHDKEEICNTIAPRCDIIHDSPFGSIDAKITNNSLLKEMKSHIIYGPPHIKGVSKPFNFEKFGNYSHLGIPEIFDFDWIEA